MPTFKMRATYEEIEWLGDSEYPAEYRGYTDPNNPWDGLDSEVPEGLVGEAFSVWRDNPDNVDTVTFTDYGGFRQVLC